MLENVDLLPALSDKEYKNHARKTRSIYVIGAGRMGMGRTIRKILK